MTADGSGEEALARARRLVGTPLGAAGSGRVRYGAAMELWRAGELSTADLEAYRICANLDHEDPAGLARRVPAAPRLAAAGAIRAAVEAIDTCLASTSGPGIAEVRAGIAAVAGAEAVAPPLPRKLGPAGLFDQALGAVEGHRELAEALRAVAPVLDWVTYDSYPREQIGSAFAEGHSFASLIDPEGPIRAGDFSLGLFVIGPNILYRDHAHPAPELYLPLTGPHRWRFRPGATFVTKPAFEPVWNDPERPHATKVGRVPFLAIFGWTRDVNAPAHVLHADDWAEIEAET